MLSAGVPGDRLIDEAGDEGRPSVEEPFWSFLLWNGQQFSSHHGAALRVPDGLVKAAEDGECI